MSEHEGEAQDNAMPFIPPNSLAPSPAADKDRHVALRFLLIWQDVSCKILECLMAKSYHDHAISISV